MYVIRNRLNEQYATGHWFGGGNKHAWGTSEVARQYPCLEEARGEMVSKAYAGTCEVVELPRNSLLKRCVAGLRRFVLARRRAALDGPAEE